MVDWLPSLSIDYKRLSNLFSYLAAITITGDRAVNLDLCLALMAFSSEGSCMCQRLP
jgi:hypothetical protein